jgi:hypothetical protein
MLYKKKPICSVIARIGLVFCLVTIAIPASAQTPDKSVLLEFKACDRELRVSNDGTVVETRHAITTERRLSATQMRKLRRVIARAPCLEQWKKWQQPSQSTAEVPPIKDSNITAVTNFDCVMEWLSAGIGLDEVQVTLYDADGKVGPLPIYIVCDHARAEYKRSARQNYPGPRFLKPVWLRFLAEVSKTVGGKSILEGCNCWQ